MIAHAIAGHHAGLPDTIGDDASLDARLKRDIEALDPSWPQEISPVATGLMPAAIDWGDRSSFAYRLAFFGRMLFSCLVDADFRDTEAFYCKAEGRSVDRQWPQLPDVVERADLRGSTPIWRKRPPPRRRRRSTPCAPKFSSHVRVARLRRRRASSR